MHKVKDAVTGHGSSSKGSSGQYDSAKQGSNYGSNDGEDLRSEFSFGLVSDLLTLHSVPRWIFQQQR